MNFPKKVKSSLVNLLIHSFPCILTWCSLVFPWNYLPCRGTWHILACLGCFGMPGMNWHAHNELAFLAWIGMFWNAFSCPNTHRYSLACLGTPLECIGTPLDSIGAPLECIGTSWNSLACLQKIYHNIYQQYLFCNNLKH